MFFDEVKLSKDSWYHKVLEFTFGDKFSNLQNFCPYFWLCIAATLLSPFVFIFKCLITWPLKLIDKHLFIPRYEKWIENISDEEFHMLRLSHPNDRAYIPFGIYFWLENNDYWDRKDKSIENIMSSKNITMYIDSDEFWNEKTKEYKKYINDSKQKWKLKNKYDTEENKKYRIERYNQKLKRDQEWKKFYNKYFSWYDKLCTKSNNVYDNIQKWFKNLTSIASIVKWTKRIVATILTIIGILILTFGLKWLIYDIIYLKTTIEMWVTVLKWISIGILGICIIAGISFILSKLIIWFQNIDIDILSYFENSFFRSIGHVIMFIYNLCYNLIKWIIKPFGFIILYLRATKNDNCPGIVWEENNKNDENV